MPGSSVAEQVTVNHLVAGSIPARAATRRAVQARLARGRPFISTVLRILFRSLRAASVLSKGVARVEGLSTFAHGRPFGRSVVRRWPMVAYRRETGVECSEQTKCVEGLSPQDCESQPVPPQWLAREHTNVPRSRATCCGDGAVLGLHSSNGGWCIVRRAIEQCLGKTAEAPPGDWQQIYARSWRPNIGVCGRPLGFSRCGVTRTPA